jgi:hypothetical protein
VLARQQRLGIYVLQILVYQLVVANFQNVGIIQNDMVALSGNMFPILMHVRALLPPENHGLIVIRQVRTQ